MRASLAWTYLVDTLTQTKTMDWYRKKTWTNKDEKEFFVRLNRAQKSNRPQYLKIQAIELIQTKDSKNLEVAESLLNQMLSDYPDDKINKSAALCSLGEIHEIRKDLETALSYFKQSIEFEKEFPNVGTQSFLKYAEIIIRLQQEDKYDEVLEMLQPKLQESIFPVEKYKISSILSIIYNQQDHLDLANKFKRIADENANAETSGLRYHKHLGLVENGAGWLNKLSKGK